jgi:L-ascorbate metabolism protein UlaG (beta-lactamase superfamily)
MKSLFSFNYISRTAWPWLALVAAFCFIATATLAAEKTLTGDRIPTTDGDLIVHPVNHASLLLGWKAEVIYVDPVGGAARYADLPAATLVLITDIHGDHLDANTLQAVAGEHADLLVSRAAAEKLPAALRSRAKSLANGEKAVVRAITCRALPAYNLTTDRLNFHPKGRGNGYVLTLGGKQVYLSGDTEDIPEMRALKDIDVAFLCMNLPYTMEVEKAAEAVRAFKPKIVYPYHSRGSDLEQFKKLVAADSGTEVRLRDWYAK